MFGLTLIEKLLYCLDLCATLALVVRLLTSGLYKTYGLFFAFLCTSFVGECVGAGLAARTDFYAYWFIGVETVRTLFSAVIILDLYSLVLKDLPGLARVAKRYFAVALGISIAGSLLLLSFEQFPSSTLVKYFVFHRAISTSLVLFILLITAFLVYYPVPLARNVIVYTIGYAVYFLTHSAAFLLITSSAGGQAWVDPLSKVLQFVSFASMIYWVVFLTRAGETKIRSTVPRMNRDQERLVLQKLEAINASLMRTTKK